jgi:hypothetical protein
MSSLRRVVSIVIALLIVVSFASSRVTVSAQDAPVQAYVWADDPTAESYTPNEQFQFNSTGEANMIVRTGTGAYTVNMPGTNPGLGNIQLTAASGSAEGSEFVPGTVCKIDRAPTGSEQFVVCFDAAGEPVDSAFTLMYTSGDVYLGEHGAYLWANDPMAESYTPDERYQFNSTQGVNTITRSEAGHYVVTLPGLATHMGNFQVTPASGSTLGEVPAVSCGISSWGDAGNDARGVTVICSDSDGALTDTGFTLQYAVGPAASSEGTATIWARGAYAMVNHSTATNRYDAGPNVRFNTTGAINAIQRTEQGKYTVTLMNVGKDGGNVQVSAWGTESSAATCNVSYWGLEEGTDGQNFLVHVACYDADGNAADSHLWVSYVMPEE